MAPLMIAAARQKALAAGLTSTFVVGDASAPTCHRSFDVVLGRHVLWASRIRPRHWADGSRSCDPRASSC